MNIQNKLLTINPMSRPGSKINEIKKIVVHYVGNPNTTAIANRNYFENLKNQDKTYASSQYIIGLEGEIICCVPEDEVAWHAGDYNMNLKSIGIENCHPDVNGKFNEYTLKSLQELAANICKKYNLDPMNDIIRHYDVIGKRCPRYYVDNEDEWKKVKQGVKDLMTGRPIEPDVNGEKYVVTATLGLNIRKEPNTTSQIVGGYSYNQEIEILEIENNWGKTDKGFVSMEWIQKPNLNHGEEYRIVATLGLNVRSGPDVNSSKVTAYMYNTIITIYEVQNGWGRTKDGYVSMNFVTKIKTQGTSYKVIATLGLNYRKGPSMSDEKVGAYKYNTIITIYEISNRWGRTNDGWISMDFVTKV